MCKLHCNKGTLTNTHTQPHIRTSYRTFVYTIRLSDNLIVSCRHIYAHTQTSWHACVQPTLRCSHAHTHIHRIYHNVSKLNSCWHCFEFLFIVVGLFVVYAFVFIYFFYLTCSVECVPPFCCCCCCVSPDLVGLYIPNTSVSRTI